MKKLLFTLALLIMGSTAFSHGAFAAVCNSNTDHFTNGQWCISSADTLIPSSTAGQQVVYETVSGVSLNSPPRIMLAKESGKVITDLGGGTTGATTGMCGKYVLPIAAPGLSYTFTTGTRCKITVDTLNSTDTFLYSISGTGFAAGESMLSTGQAGDSVTVTSTGATTWSIDKMHSAWTNNGAN